MPKAVKSNEVAEIAEVNEDLLKSVEFMYSLTKLWFSMEQDEARKKVYLDALCVLALTLKRAKGE